MEQSFPLKISLWLGKPAEFPPPGTKSEEEKDVGQAATIILQTTGWGKRKQSKH